MILHLNKQKNDLDQDHMKASPFEFREINVNEN